MSPPKRKDPSSSLIRVTQQSLDFGGFQLTATGLSVNGRPTYDDWQRCGVLLRRMEGAVQWWIGDWLNYGANRYHEKYNDAVDSLEFDRQTLKDFAYVAQNIPSSRRRDDVNFSVHREVASLPAPQQREVLDRAARDAMTVADVRLAIRELKRADTLAAPFPDGVFRVVYADPPWQYNDSGVIVEGDAYGRAERHYPTMPLEEIAALPVRAHVADDAVLFLWVTSPMLNVANTVIDAWGFTYKTSIVWDKVQHNYGHYVSVRHELLLIATRGSCTPDAPTPMPDSVIVEPRSSSHSGKPPLFRALIDRLYPVGPAVELFSRWAPPSRSRWTVYGNQFNGD